MIYNAKMKILSFDDGRVHFWTVSPTETSSFKQFLYILYFKHFISLENNGLSRSIGLNKVLKTATLSNKTNKKTARTKSPQKVLHLFSTLD